jgi:para-nitrobenzyl esterase
MKTFYRWLAIWAVSCAGAASAAHAAIEFADVTGGRVKGEVANGITTFKGLPFAAPPVGALRWQIPQPLIPWQGTRDATHFAPACMQPWGGGDKPPISEDCLYLNVWTAAATAKEKRPVMVWIHGGGLRGGMSWESLSNGAKLAPEGVVLVTIAYRLGPLGFLAHPDLTRESGGKGSGNYGLFDVVAALKWVQANIAQFGGDPSRVTIAGGSAGGSIVGFLAGAPDAKGLYARALAIGGAAFYPELREVPPHLPFLPTLKMGEDAGAAFFKSLGVTNVQAARMLPAQSLASAPEDNEGFTLIIDGALVRDPNVALFEHGRFNDTPILVGFTSDEFGDPTPNASVDWVKARIGGSSCAKTAAAIDAAYPHATAEEANLATRHIYRDFFAGWPAWTWAKLQTAKGRGRAYLYVFDAHDRDHPHGAPHSTEYPYIFGNFVKPPSASDIATSALMRQYLINFAARGDPNGPGLPVWKAFDAESPSAMVFAESSESLPLPNLEGLKALDAHLRCSADSRKKP